MKNISSTKLVIGGVLIILGVAMLLDQLVPQFEFDFFGLVFPLLILFAGVTSILRNPNKPMWGIIITFVGSSLLVGQLLNISLWQFWPIILVIAGFLVIFGQKDMLNGASTNHTDSKLEDTVIFWGLEKKVDSQEFQGGEVTAVFGGVELDLRGAKMTKDANIEVNAVFGGVNILVSEDTNVMVNGTGIFGGFHNKASRAKDAKQTLIISGAAVFGGVEIK